MYLVKSKNTVYAQRYVFKWIMDAKTAVPHQYNNESVDFTNERVDGNGTSTRTENAGNEYTPIFYYFYLMSLPCARVNDIDRTWRWKMRTVAGGCRPRENRRVVWPRVDLSRRSVTGFGGRVGRETDLRPSHAIFRRNAWKKKIANKIKYYYVLSRVIICWQKEKKPRKNRPEGFVFTKCSLKISRETCPSDARVTWRKVKKVKKYGDRVDQKRLSRFEFSEHVKYIKTSEIRMNDGVFSLEQFWPNDSAVVFIRRCAYTLIWRYTERE